MFLLGYAGTYTQITLVLILTLAIFGLYIFLCAGYVWHIFNDNNQKAERFIAYAGYYAIFAMISLFLIFSFGFKNSIVGLDKKYYGLFAAFGGFLVLPPMIIADYKQIKWIKALTIDEQKEYGISVKDRLPLIIVISILALIALALFGICVERFIYVLEGLIN